MALRALRAAALALLPSIALAQAAAVTVSPSQVNQADCAGTGNVSVTWTTTFSSGDTARVVAAGSCPATAPAENGTGTLGIDVTLTQTTQTQNFTVASIKSAVTANCTGTNDTAVNVCVYRITGGGTGASNTVGSATFTFQTAVPPTPVNVTASPANSAIEVSFGAGTKGGNYQADTLQYEVQYKPAGGTYVSNGRSSTSPVRIGGLTNGTTYTVSVFAWSAVNPPLVGNQSPPSTEASATPDNFLDYWSRYKTDGGREEGGCGAGGAGALAPLLLALAVFLRRRA